jgi:hypothetical protein
MPTTEQEAEREQRRADHLLTRLGAAEELDNTITELADVADAVALLDVVREFGDVNEVPVSINWNRARTNRSQTFYVRRADVVRTMLISTPEGCAVIVPPTVPSHQTSTTSTTPLRADGLPTNYAAKISVKSASADKRGRQVFKVEILTVTDSGQRGATAKECV